MPYTNGNTTLSTFNKLESQKLFSEFDVSGVVHKGQPVKLTAAGAVEAALATDPASVVIGVSIHEGNSIYGATVVVSLKGFGIINCFASAAVAPGPVTYDGYDTTKAYPGTQKEFAGYNKVKTFVFDSAATVNVQSTVFGWAIDAAAAAGDIVRVVVAA